MTAEYLNAEDFDTGFNFELAGWARCAGNAAARILDLTGGQNAFVSQSSSVNCVFYSETPITTPNARVGFILPSNFGDIQNAKGAALINSTTDSGYAIIHNGGNPGDIELRLITAGVLGGTAVASVGSTAWVIDNQFDMYRNQATGEMEFYQEGVLKMTHTDNTFGDTVHPAWVSLGDSANVVSLIYEAIGGTVVSLTDPLVMGDPLTLVTSGFSDITSITGGGLSATGVSFAGGTTTATWPTISESITPTVYLPAAGVTITVSDGLGGTVDVVRDIDLDTGWAAVEFGAQIDEPDYLLADVPIESGNRAYYETEQPDVGTVEIFPDGSVYTDAGGVITFYLHKMGDPLVEYNVTAPAGGVTPESSSGIVKNIQKTNLKSIVRSIIH